MQANTRPAASKLSTYQYPGKWRKLMLALGYRQEEMEAAMQKALRLAEMARKSEPWGVLTCDYPVLDAWLISRRSFYQMLKSVGDIPRPKAISFVSGIHRMAGDAAEREYLRYEGTRYGITPFIRSFSGAKKSL